MNDIERARAKRDQRIAADAAERALKTEELSRAMACDIIEAVLGGALLRTIHAGGWTTPQILRRCELTWILAGKPEDVPRVDVVFEVAREIEQELLASKTT